LIDDHGTDNSLGIDYEKVMPEVQNILRPADLKREPIRVGILVFLPTTGEFIKWFDSDIMLPRHFGNKLTKI
jgi:hypothetical protein